MYIVLTNIWRNKKTKKRLQKQISLPFLRKQEGYQLKKQKHL